MQDIEDIARDIAKDEHGDLALCLEEGLTTAFYRSAEDYVEAQGFVEDFEQFFEDHRDYYMEEAREIIAKEAVQ